LKSSGKTIEKGEVPQGIYRFYKKVGHHMKDYVEFLRFALEGDSTKRMMNN
jgi:hypothetical protein